MYQGPQIAVFPAALKKSAMGEKKRKTHGEETREREAERAGVGREREREKECEQKQNLL